MDRQTSSSPIPVTVVPPDTFDALAEEWSNMLLYPYLFYDGSYEDHPADGSISPLASPFLISSLEQLTLDDVSPGGYGHPTSGVSSSLNSSPFDRPYAPAQGSPIDPPAPASAPNLPRSSLPQLYLDDGHLLSGRYHQEFMSPGTIPTSGPHDWSHSATSDGSPGFSGSTSGSDYSRTSLSPFQMGNNYLSPEGYSRGRDPWNSSAPTSRSLSQDVPRNEGPEVSQPSDEPLIQGLRNFGPESSEQSLTCSGLFFVEPPLAPASPSHQLHPIQPDNLSPHTSDGVGEPRQGHLEPSLSPSPGIGGREPRQRRPSDSTGSRVTGKKRSQGLRRAASDKQRSPYSRRALAIERELPWTVEPRGPPPLTEGSTPSGYPGLPTTQWVSDPVPPGVGGMEGAAGVVRNTVASRALVQASHARRTTTRVPFECPYCSDTTTTRQNLQNHINVHMGLKPYKCDACNARFTVQRSRDRHSQETCPARRT